MNLYPAKVMNMKIHFKTSFIKFKIKNISEKTVKSCLFLF